MSLREDMATELSGVFFDPDDFATQGLYTSISGAVATVNVIIDLSVQRDGFESQVAVDHDEITFAKSDICEPKRGDTFDDGTYSVEFVSRITDDEQTSIWLVK
jgi:hypothetical protein